MPALTLYVNPYGGRPGFYFSDLDYLEKKLEKTRIEEFEIEFIDGEDSEQELFEVMNVSAINIDDYFELVEDLDEDQILSLKILVDNLGYDFDDALTKMDDVIVYGEFDSDEVFAMEYVDQIGSLEDALGDNIQSYFDYEEFGRDLRIGGDLDDPDHDEDEDGPQWWEDLDDQEIGEQMADDLGWEGLGKINLEMYFDWKKFARDLMMDMGREGKVYYDARDV